jgi:hypothetical protein
MKLSVPKLLQEMGVLEAELAASSESVQPISSAAGLQRFRSKPPLLQPLILLKAVAFQEESVVVV